VVYGCAGGGGDDVGQHGLGQHRLAGASGHHLLCRGERLCPGPAFIFVCDSRGVDCRCVVCVALRAHVSGVRITSSTVVWVAGPDVGVALASPSYSNFLSGEPNDMLGGESCIELDISLGQWNDNVCTKTQGYVVEFEPFSAAWPAVDTFVPGGSGSAYQLLTTPQTFADALALSPAPPLGRMVCWCDAHRSRLRRRLSCNTGDGAGGDWGCRFAVMVLCLTLQRPARVTTRGSQPTP
jgi:hypothetical protein